jgi:predicted ATPase
MKPLLKLTLFGAPTITLGDQPLTGALTGKLLALFLYLAVTAAKGELPHQREALADLFWSELPRSQRRSNLRYLLSDLRGIVGDYLLITPQTVCFNRQAPYWLDVEVVCTALTAALRATDAKVATALALYQDEFLAGFRVRNAPAFMQWVATQRQELHNLIIHAPQPAPDQPPVHNLPRQLTPFFGREAEIADILAHLTQDGCRLLTIIGEGGVGKTRLALAVAQTILDSRSFQDKLWTFDSKAVDNDNLKSKIVRTQWVRGAHAEVQNLKFPDGVWFVPLADLSATADLPNQVATAIANALDFPLQGQGAPAMQIYHYLAHKRLLLLLDNFEQLVAHTEVLLTLLQKCSGFRLLVTSRRLLNAQAEYPWRLTGLPLPPPAQAATLAPAELLPYAGVALFVERARRANPQFQLTPANQAAVVALCHWVEGLPLGIELAAALCKEYTCAALLTALQTDYALLTTTLPDLPVRHRSIRATLAHSWRLLDQEMAAMLAACAVFQGGFTVGAATAVIGALPTTIQRLVDHSLLRTHRHETTGWRYDLHELVRHYAEEQLMQTPARYRQVQAHHAAYYLAQLQQIAPHLLQEGTAQAVVQCESANMRAAWHYGVAEQWIDRLFQGVEGLATFYRLTGLHNTAYLAFQPALEMVRQAEAQAQTHPLLAALLLNLSEFCRYLDRLAEAEALAQEAFTLGRQCNNAAIQCRACYERARLAQGRAQYVLMRDLAAQAYHQARQGCISVLGKSVDGRP